MALTEIKALAAKNGIQVNGNRPTAEKANFGSLIGLVFNLSSVKVFDKNSKI